MLLIHACWLNFILDKEAHFPSFLRSPDDQAAKSFVQCSARRNGRSQLMQLTYCCDAWMIRSCADEMVPAPINCQLGIPKGVVPEIPRLLAG